MELCGFEVQADEALKNCILDKRRVQSKVKVIAGDPATSPPEISFNAFSSCLPLCEGLFLLLCVFHMASRVTKSLFTKQPSWRGRETQKFGGRMCN